MPRSLPRDDDSPEDVEVEYHGYKIRNAPEEGGGNAKRPTRWDTDVYSIALPDDKETLAKQGKKRVSVSFFSCNFQIAFRR